MRTIWQSLAWKEWHEHKWNLVSILAIMVGVTLLVVLNAETRSILGASFALLIFCTVPLAVFVGLGVAAGERSRGTLPFLQALPVPLWQVALCKFFAGLATIIVPPALVVMVLYASCKLLVQWAAISPNLLGGSASPWGTGSWPADIVIVLAYLGASFFVWTIASGVNRKDEVTAGALAVTTMIGWSLILLLLWRFLTSMSSDPLVFQRSPFNWLGMAGSATIPGGLATLVGVRDEYRVYVPLACLVAAFVHFALAASYLQRFGRISDLEIRSPMAARIRPDRLDWLGPPRRSIFAATAWKQTRESWPAVLTGIAGFVGLYALIVVWNRRYYLGNPGDQILLLHGVSAAVGFVIAIILGVSVLRTDVAPGINSFWRSRPINPDLWFWTKFIGGFIIALATIYLPLMLIGGVDSLLLVLQPDVQELNVFRLAQITVFAAAVAMTCLVRQPVHAAILSILIVFVGLVATALIFAFNRFLRGQGWPDGVSEFSNLSAAQTASGLIATFVISTLVAWLAVRNDWGQKALR